MFLDFYQMREQPFGVTPDSRFLYFGKSHREALASLFYSIEADRGFAALIAPPGMGKTTLTFQLLEKLQRASRTVFLFQTQCNSRELFHYLLNELGIDANAMDVVTMHHRLNSILSREMLAGRRFILAIDEAQNLEPEVLETIRLLSNFETSRSKLIQILLIGQPQLARKLANPALEQLRQRISVFAGIEPFSPDETSRYIAHRLQAAGYEGGPLFSSEALRLIAERSQGVPRNINSLCFGALSLGCAEGRKQIDAEILREVIGDLDVEAVHRRCVTPPAAPKPATPASVLSSYGSEPRRNLGRWAWGAAGVVATMAAAIAILAYSPGGAGRFVKASTGAWISIRNAEASTRIPTKPNPPSLPPVAEQGVEIPAVEPAPPLAPSETAEAPTDEVIVRPGETLQQIIVRAMGAYNDDTVRQVQKLNPSILDLDHVEVGQKIQVPHIAAPASTVANDATENAAVIK